MVKEAEQSTNAISREMSWRRKETSRKEEESELPTVAEARDVQAHPGGEGGKYKL